MEKEIRYAFAGGLLGVGIDVLIGADPFHSLSEAILTVVTVASPAVVGFLIARSDK